MQAGAVEIEPLQDELRQFTRDVFEAAWLRARQFWTDETWVRVTDDERAVQFVGLNKPVTLEEKLAEIAEKQGPDAAQQIAMQEGIQSPYDPRLKQVVEIANQIGELDVDIEIEEGPDISTLQSEQFEALAGLAERGIPIPPDALVAASSLRNKDEILKKMRGEDEQNPQLMQAQQQIEQMGQQMQQMAQTIEQLKADRSIKAAEAETKQFAAETDRLQAVAPAMGPAEIQMLVVNTMREIMGQPLQ